MAQQPQIIPVDNYNLGGLADSKWSGVPNSLDKMTGFNPHQVPGVLRVAQKMVKISGDVVTEFCKAKVESKNGHTYFGSSESGKIWMIHGTTGVVSLIHTIVAALGESKILSMGEYQNFIYIATEKKLHRISSDAATTSGEWTTNIVLNFAAFTNGNILYHPMREQNLVFYIGDGNLLAQVDAGTFSPDALDIANPLQIKSLGKVATDLVLGTFTSNRVTKTELFRWNTYSGSFQTSNQIDEVGINAFLQTDSFLYVQAGLSGRIYVYDYINNRLESFKTIPGDYSPTAYCTTNPDAAATINGIALFGISNGLGNPCDQGIYAIGRHSRNYPYIMDMPYPLSPRLDDDEFVLSGMEIGAIAVSGFDVYVSWKRTVGAVVTVGIDKLDYTVKLNGAYLQSRVIAGNRTELKNFDKYFAAYASLPEGCDIQMSMSRNYQEFVQAARIQDGDRNMVYAEMNRLEATTLQLKLKMIASGNTAPELESAGVKLV